MLRAVSLLVVDTPLSREYEAGSIPVLPARVRSGNGNTSGLHPEIPSSTLGGSTI